MRVCCAPDAFTELEVLRAPGARPWLYVEASSPSCHVTVVGSPISGLLSRSIHVYACPPEVHAYAARRSEQFCRRLYMHISSLYTNTSMWMPPERNRYPFFLHLHRPNPKCQFQNPDRKPRGPADLEATRCKEFCPPPPLYPPCIAQTVNGAPCSDVCFLLSTSKDGKVPGIVYSDNDTGAKHGDTLMVKVDKIVLDREIRRLGASFDNTVRTQSADV